MTIEEYSVMENMVDECVAGVVVFGLEFYYSGGIQSDHPGCTAFGSPTEIITLGETHIPEGCVGISSTDLQFMLILNTVQFSDVFQEFVADLSTRFSSSSNE